MPPVQPIGPRDGDASRYFINDDPEPLFEELVEIGHGSFGAVYYARYKDSKDLVAIKKMSYGGKKAQEKWKDIVQEVKILQQLQHRNAIQYKQCYLSDHTVWLLMEYCLGSASDILEVHKCSLKEEEISVICRDTLSALEYVHSINFIHRDVKAGNILLTDSGIVKLADFGSASLSSPANSFIGTPYWMAPEVILAMDDGEYTGVADIWSLGITCIELAELKPPLFNMHAMAALYHIPQNEPPMLSDSHWSQQFRHFVEMCLQKDVENRPSATNALKHVFIEQHSPRSLDIISELINRTKAVVREMDKKHNKKIKKFLMEEPNGDSQSLAESTSSLQQQDDASSLVDESSQEDECSTGGDSKTNSLCDIHEDTTLNSEGTGTPDSSRVSSSSDLQKSEQPPALPPRRHTHLNGDLNNGHHSSGTSYPGSRHHAAAPSRRNRYNSRGDDNAQSNSAKNFATIRTPSIVKKQRVEHAQDDLFREQMSSYRKMRKQHQKELRQLDDKQRAELDALRNRLVRECDTLQTNLQAELIKLQKMHQQRRDKSKVSAQSEEDHMKKHLLKEKKAELDRYKKDLSKQRKQQEDDKKKELSSTPKKEKDEQMKSFKRSVEQYQEQAIIEKERQLSRNIDIQVRKFERKKLLGFHQLEQMILKEELDKREAQLASGGQTRCKNDEELQNMEYKHLAAVHKKREEQQRVQHAEELRHQKEYSERQEKELQKRHVLQTKRLPKSIAEKKARLRKQLKETIETQTRQYKALLDEEMARTPRSEHKNVKTRLTDEQEYKRRVLFEEYQQLEAELVTNQNVTLDETKTGETQELRRKLQQQTEELVNYQSKIRIQTNGLHSREKKELEDKVSQRRAELEQKLEVDMQRFNTERATALRELHERQAKEIGQFDRETSNMNIDPAEIYVAEDEFQRILNEDECSLSGMTVSHSNSTASFNTPL